MIVKELRDSQTRSAINQILVRPKQRTSALTQPDEIDNSTPQFKSASKSITLSCGEDLAPMLES